MRLRINRDCHEFHQNLNFKRFKKKKIKIRLWFLLDFYITIIKKTREESYIKLSRVRTKRMKKRPMEKRIHQRKTNKSLVTQNLITSGLGWCPQCTIILFISESVVRQWGIFHMKTPRVCCRTVHKVYDKNTCIYATSLLCSPYIFSRFFFFFI